MIYTGPNLDAKRKMISTEFRAKHAGAIGDKWCKFLGRLYRFVNGHFEVMIPQSYFMEVITELGLEGCKPVGTPSVAQSSAAAVESPFLDDLAHARYRRVVGKLIWTIQERPDIAQAVAACSRAVQAPTENDMIKLKRIVRYLAGTMNYRLHLRMNDDDSFDRVDVITDASWARGPDRRSVSGILLVYRGIVFGAWSRVQKVKAHSSCEAEIMAAHQGVVEAKLLTHLLSEQFEVQRPADMKTNLMIHLSVDSTSTVGFTARRGPGALKHIDLKYLSLQDDVREGLLRVGHVRTDILLADYLTKPTCEYKLTQFCQAVRLTSESTLESNGTDGVKLAELRDVQFLELPDGDETHLVELAEEGEDLERREENFEIDKKLWLMLFTVVVLAVLGCVDMVKRVRRALRRFLLSGRQRGTYPTATPQNRAAAAARDSF